MTFDKNFQVDLDGVIRLLSDHLYSGPEVFVRELLQNAVDAITARNQSDNELQGLIRVESIGSDSAPTISVEDNGIGLTEDEVSKFLATIGQSSKTGDFDRTDFIGQFGIGLLSGFLVSDEITVITQSIKAGAPAVEWRGRNDGTYSTRTLDQDLSPGTRVYLRAKPGMEPFFQPEQLEELLAYYGKHLPHTIELNNNEHTKQINEVAPWHQKHSSLAAQRSAYLEYGEKHLGTKFLDAVPISSNEGDVQGVAFVLPFAASPSGIQKHHVYLKNMFLSDSAEGLLPSWAFFVKCIVNANNLRPNAARENFYKDDALKGAQNQLGACLRTYLVDLASHDPETLNRILSLHYLPIKALALEDNDFFRLVIDWLSFETTLGTVTLGDYFKSNSHFQYVDSHDQFRQIASVAKSQNICVFNGGYAYDSELFELISESFSRRKVTRIGVADVVHGFEELTLAESDQVFDFAKQADEALGRHSCMCEFRKFSPTELPALYVTNDMANFLRNVETTQSQVDDAWGGLIENVAKSSDKTAFANLILNYENDLVKKLVHVKESKIVPQIVDILYLQSLLLGHYPLKQSEMEIISKGFINLIDQFLEFSG